jgi:hypothetical protein
MVVFMSEMYHPPVSSEYDLVTPFRQIFAEESFATLNSYHYNVNWYNDAGEEQSETVTPRFDTFNDNGELVTIRLKRIEICNDDTARNVMYGEKIIDAGRISKSIPFVTVLQYAVHEVDEDDEDFAEEDLVWVPYVFLAIDSAREDQVVILDAQTGRELTDEQVLHALDRVRALRSNLVSEEFYSAMLDNETIEYERKDEIGRHVVFDPGEWVFGKACPECESDYALCDHNENRAWKN